MTNKIENARIKYLEEQRAELIGGIRQVLCIIAVRQAVGHLADGDVIIAKVLQAVLAIIEEHHK